MHSKSAMVIGAGPAGLMAAEILAQAGLAVTLAEAKPSPARKFLMAGKSGLNLTKHEPLADFLAAFQPPWVAPIIADFGPEAVMAWAEGLGQPLFTGSTGRVFPLAMKGSALLRAWLARLDALGVQRKMRWRWCGLAADGALDFATPEGAQRIARPAVTILALGGASWARLGSDGAWAAILAQAGVAIAGFQPANMGFRIAWSDHMTPYLGQPVKGVALIAGDWDGAGLAPGSGLGQGPPQISRGECVISARGIEGGGIYALSAALRAGAPLWLDLAPDRSLQALTQRLAARPRGKDSLANHLRKTLGLEGARLALLQEWGRPLPQDPAGLARRLKALAVPHHGPRPLDEAISVAGGIRAEALTPGLELRALPGIFAAGEMLDWEAPTGGYLLTGCLATGRHAALAALESIGAGSGRG